MNTSDTPQQPAENAAAPNEASGAAPLTPSESAKEQAPVASNPPDRAARAHEDEDDGPQPGNVAPPKAHDDDDEDAGDAPAPGNERFPATRPGAQAQGDPTGSSAAKRRRRRKKARAAHGGEPASGQPASAEGAEAGQPSEGPAGERRDKKRRPPRHFDRERPAFNVGDVTFGKILEITDDALFIDLMGKGTAIFDRHELELPDEDPNAPPEPEEAEDGHAEGAAKAEETTEAASLAEGLAEAASPAPETTPAEAPVAEPLPPSNESNGVAPTAPEAEAKAEGEEAAPSSEPSPGNEAAHTPPVPPVVLEMGAHFVGVVHNDGGRGGLVVLTRHPRRVSKTKPKVAGAFKDKTTVMGLVTGVIKGGIEVDVDGLRAFAPGSHVDLRLGADLTNLVGKRLPFFVTQYAKRGRDVVLSRKALLETEARKAREEALKRLQVGAVVEGTVRSVVPFGAFIDVGDVEGLVPLTEMSHNRSEGPSDVFKAGEKVQVKITKIDDKGKVWLSRKATIPDPWSEVAKKYANGTRHTGKVVRIQPFGAFVELESGVDGLIHTVDMATLSIQKRVEHPEEVVKVGDSLDVVVAHVDAASHRIALHPALTGDAANDASQRVQQYRMVKAQIMAIEASGLVVRIQGVTGRNARGFITAAGTGTPRGTELRKVFPVGQVVEAKVMEIDPKRGEVKLSIKALNDESERNAYQQYRQQVSREAKFTFGDLLAKKLQNK